MGGLAAFINYLSVQIMDEAEQTQLKAGKSFWTWSSSYGPLSLHYVEKGAGNDHLLLIHGFRAHTYTWELLIDPLTKAGYHVWVLDLVGFGLSDKPEHVFYDQNFFTAQIKAFMKAKKISSAHLLGNSMGGGLALEIALEEPDIVNSLILINALGYPLDVPYYLYIVRYLDFIWGPFLNPPMIRNCLNEVIFNKDCITDEKVEAYCLPYRFPGGILASLLTMRHFNIKKLNTMHQRYSEIQMPVLIVWGEKDMLIPLDHYKKFRKDFPHAKHYLIPECGHMPQEEKPDDMIRIILPFLQELQEEEDAA